MHFPFIPSAKPLCLSRDNRKDEQRRKGLFPDLASFERVPNNGPFVVPPSGGGWLRPPEGGTTNADQGGSMTDKSNQLLVDALQRAVTDPAGIPLFGGKKAAGLFAASAPAKKAAQLCKDEG